MLDLMRRKKRLKGVLWFVIIAVGLSMFVYLIPGLGGPVGPGANAATVDGDPISVRELADTYRRVVENYRAGGKNKLDPQTMKLLRLGRQALNYLIEVRVTRYAAKQHSLSVTPSEIRRMVEQNPSFLEKGAFIGIQRYKNLLAANNIKVSEYEDGIRFVLLSNKIRNVIADSIEFTEQELRDEFLYTTQQAEVSFVLLDQEDFKRGVDPVEESVREYFEANKGKYVIKEKRRTQYLLLSLSDLVPTIPVTEEEIRDQWNRERPEETVTASHILFSVDDPSEDEEKKAIGMAILQRAKAGEDFAELARENSDDTVSAEQGGSLGTFGRDRMVPEFSNVAFSLEVGEISDLVKTQFGYHIIKVLNHNIPTLESNRNMLKNTVQMNKANDLLKKKAEEAQRLAETQMELDAIGKDLDIPYQVKETDFLEKGTDPYSQGISPAFLDEVFSLKKVGSIGKAVSHPLGQALPKLLEISLPKPADFTVSRADVEEDYIDSKSLELLRTKAKELAEAASEANSLEKAARANRLTVKRTQPFKRDGIADSDIGSAPNFNGAAFSLDVGAVSEPIAMNGGNRIAVLQVRSRTPLNEEEFQIKKEEIRDTLTGRWQDAYYSAYIKNIQKSLERADKIRINQRAVDQVTGAGF